MDEQNRRDFLKAAVGLGTIAATAGMPTFADDPSVFPKRGDHTRLNIIKVHVEAGAKQPFSVLHISDTHLTDAYPDEDEFKQQLLERSTRGFGGHQEESLRDSLAWAKDNCDYVIHTGDLLDWQSRKNLDLVKKYYGMGMKSPGMFGSLGNHEFTEYHYKWQEAQAAGIKFRNRDENLVHLAKYYPFDVTCDSRVINGVNFVSMDDEIGTFSERQVEFFRQQVAKGLPIVLCIHVPILTDFIRLMNHKYWNYGMKFRSAELPEISGSCRNQRNDRVTREFIAYLKTEKLLKAILSGHLHFTVQDRFSPTCMEYVIGGNYMFLGEEVSFT